MGKIGQQLFFELQPGTAGYHGHFDDAEQVMQQGRHLGVEGRLALGERPVEIEDDQLLQRPLLRRLGISSGLSVGFIRERYLQQADGTARPEHAQSDLRRQEHDLASSDGICGPGMLEASRTLEAHEHPRHIRRADGEGRLAAQAPQAELVTGEESLAPYRRGRLHHGNYRAERTLRKVKAGQRLFDVECSRLAGLRVNMAPVVQAKRDVAVLLYLEHHDVATERVHRPGRQEDALAGLRSEHATCSASVPLAERPPQIVGRGPWLQARIDAAVYPRLQHDPCFGLPALASW